MEPVVEGGGGAGRGGAVALDGCETELDGETGVPEARGLVHVLVEPPAARRQVELADEQRELRVQASEQRGRPKQRRQRRQAAAAAAEVVQPPRQGREEGVHHGSSAVRSSRALSLRLGSIELAESDGARLAIYRARAREAQEEEGEGEVEEGD